MVPSFFSEKAGLPYGVIYGLAFPPIGSIRVVMDMKFQRIEDLRVDNDLTQKKVAQYLHMHLEVYRRYEKGIREIPVWAVIQLAQLYHVSTDYILGLTERRK
jgi:DNA-binding XRE family transcriptional regulator